MNYIIKLLNKSGILESDLDYHFIRASMVIIFFFFWIPKMVELRSAGTNPLHQQWPAYFLDVPCFRHQGRYIFLRGFGMDIWRTPVPGILE